MRTLMLLLQAVLFSAAFTASPIDAATPDLLFASVSRNAVVLVSLHYDSSGGRAAVRTFRVDAARTDGISETYVPDGTLSVTLARDGSQAIITTPGGTTRRYGRINAVQESMLLEMARFGGLAAVCSAHKNAGEICASMARLAGVYPFRPFPSARPFVADRTIQATVRLADVALNH